MERGQICCTTRTLQEIGLKPGQCQMPEERPDDLRTWYAQLFFVGGHKHLLLFNPVTTLSAYVLDVRREQLRQMGELASSSVGVALDLPGVPEELRMSVCESMREPVICRTNDKGALACMNQALLCSKHTIEFNPCGWDPFTAETLTRHSNLEEMVRYETPMKTLSLVLDHLRYQTDADAVRSALHEHYRSRRVSVTQAR